MDAARRADSIVATVTSGLSINTLAEGRSESFRKNFLGLHFFNPPNVIVGTELIAGKDTDPGLLDFIETYSEKKLGRTMIRTHDTAGFAGNRVGFKVLNECAILAEEHGPALIDKVVGPYTGRALTPLATVDLVGWDIHRAIVDNIVALTKDEAHSTLVLPKYMAELMDKGTLGNKSGRGFFMRDGKRKLALIPGTDRYQPVDEIKFPDLSYIAEIAELHRIGRYDAAMAAFVAARAEADLARGHLWLHHLLVPPRGRVHRHHHGHRPDHGSGLQLGAAQRAGGHHRPRADHRHAREVGRPRARHLGERRAGHALLQPPHHQRRQVLRRRLSVGSTSREGENRDVQRSLYPWWLPDRLRPQLEQGAQALRRHDPRVRGRRAA
ncbi:MAG: 3-hydroxyacyl-CoA dehydrogenase family protein [Sandaracinaceae bacterium]|nr:3-hydroxyacyl-CoA dehydrogenase family protein [Sandaracinaceae bacterium]